MNGGAFLFILPISRREYVYEKYGFCLLHGALSLALSVAFSVLKNIPIGEALTVSSLIFGIMIVMLAVMIPIQLNFGAEKSRIALFAASGIVAALCFCVAQILLLLDVDTFAPPEKLLALPLGMQVAVIAVIVTALLLLSVRISVAIMNRKES